MNKFVFGIAKVLPFKLLQFLNGKKIILPFYHLISDNETLHIKNLYKLKTIKQFGSDLIFFKKYFFPIKVQDFCEIVKNKKKISKNMFLLTFDDGLFEVYKNILPILKNQNLESILFINPDFVDNKDIFYRYKISVIIEELRNQNDKLLEIESLLKKERLFYNSVNKSLLFLNSKNLQLINGISIILNIDFKSYVAKNKIYMNLNELIELNKTGFYIGAHSLNHEKYSELSVHEQLEQTIESVNFVKKHFEQDYKFFAFPFTDNLVKADFFSYIFENNIVDISFGTAGIKDDLLFNYQRIPMENGFTAKSTLKYHYLASFLRRILFMNKIKR